MCQRDSNEYRDRQLATDLHNDHLLSLKSIAHPGYFARLDAATVCNL